LTQKAALSLVISIPKFAAEGATPRFSQDLVEADLDVDPYLGTIFNGKYELAELIGGGGSGLVYRAKQLE
jgi:hypothetical protein